MLSDDPYGDDRAGPVPEPAARRPEPRQPAVSSRPRRASTRSSTRFIDALTPGHLHPADRADDGLRLPVRRRDRRQRVARDASESAPRTRAAISDTWTKATLLGAGALLLPDERRSRTRHRLAERARRPQSRSSPRPAPTCSTRPRSPRRTQTFAGTPRLQHGLPRRPQRRPTRSSRRTTSTGRRTSPRRAPPTIAGNTGFGYGDTTHDRVLGGSERPLRRERRRRRVEPRPAPT